MEGPVVFVLNVLFCYATNVLFFYFSKKSARVEIKVDSKDLENSLKVAQVVLLLINHFLIL